MYETIETDAKKYRLRVDVAKPSEIYQPSFGPSRPSPALTNNAAQTNSNTNHNAATPKSNSNKSIEAHHEPDNPPEPKNRKRSRAPVKTNYTYDAAAIAQRAVSRILSRRVHDGGATSYLVVWSGTPVTEAAWYPKAALVPAHASLLTQFDSAVRRVRSSSLEELEERKHALSTLGLPNATYFQGVSSRGPDGSPRKAASAVPRAISRSASAASMGSRERVRTSGGTKPRSRGRSTGGGTSGAPTGAAGSSLGEVAAHEAAANGGLPPHVPAEIGKRQGLAPVLSGFFKRKLGSHSSVMDRIVDYTSLDEPAFKRGSAASLSGLDVAAPGGSVVGSRSLDSVALDPASSLDCREDMWPQLEDATGPPSLFQPTQRAAVCGGSADAARSHPPSGLAAEPEPVPEAPKRGPVTTRVCVTAEGGRARLVLSVLPVKAHELRAVTIRLQRLWPQPPTVDPCHSFSKQPPPPPKPRKPRVRNKAGGGQRVKAAATTAAASVPTQPLPMAPPPIVPTVATLPTPETLAYTVVSALTPNQLADKSGSWHFTLNPQHTFLPKALPGHVYAMGARRGSYAVLQPVAVSSEQDAALLQQLEPTQQFTQHVAAPANAGQQQYSQHHPVYGNFVQVQLPHPLATGPAPASYPMMANVGTNVAGSPSYVYRQIMPMYIVQPPPPQQQQQIYLQQQMAQPQQQHIYRLQQMGHLQQQADYAQQQMLQQHFTQQQANRYMATQAELYAGHPMYHQVCHQAGQMPPQLMHGGNVHMGAAHFPGHPGQFRQVVQPQQQCVPSLDPAEAGGYAIDGAPTSLAAQPGTGDGGAALGQPDASLVAPSLPGAPGTELAPSGPPDDARPHDAPFIQPSGFYLPVPNGGYIVAGQQTANELSRAMGPGAPNSAVKVVGEEYTAADGHS